MPLNLRRAVSAGCVVAGLALPLSAQAASSGVHVDPNSPPGKEYAIPLDAARSQDSGPAPVASGPGATATGQPSRPATSTPTVRDNGLFGAGISRAPAARAARAKRPSAFVPASPHVAAAADPNAGNRGGGSTPMFWVAAALAVLIPGVAVGIGVRRWRHA